MLEFDHLIIRVAELDEAGRRYKEQYGLDSAFGGRHAGLGTANRIVPLGRDYLELLAVVDHQEQAQSRIPLPEPECFAGWMVRTNDIEAVAERLGLGVRPMSRRREDGEVVAWNLAGLEVMLGEPSLPGFIDWSADAPHHPARMPVQHDVEPAGVASIELGGDGERIKRWCDGLDLAIQIGDGPPGVRAARMVVDGEEIELRFDRPDTR